MSSIVPFIFYLVLANLVYQANMAYLDVASFFNLTNNNISSITWAHAVNSASLLTASLNSTVMMLEADVVMGNITGTNETIPIMAHPPANTSDLSLAQFLSSVSTFNANTNSSIIKKGVKLDFKTIEALESSADNIASLYNSTNYPLWINADILGGPGNSTNVPVDAARFFAIASQFPNSTLSIGWTTNYASNATSYQTSHIDEMLTTIRSNNVTNKTITFPVRAGMAAESPSEMQRLLANYTGSTLTLWSSEGDPVNVTKLRDLIRTVGVNKTFIDVTDSVEKELSLSTLDGAGSMIAPVTYLLGVLVAAHLF